MGKVKCVVCNSSNCGMTIVEKISASSMSTFASKLTMIGDKVYDPKSSSSLSLIKIPELDYFSPRCPDCENKSHNKYFIDFVCSCGHVWYQHNESTHLCEHCSFTEPCFPHTQNGYKVANTGLNSISRVYRGKGYPGDMGERNHCITCQLGLTSYLRLPQVRKIRNDVATNFGLDRKLVLYEWAANFYLMLEMRVTPSTAKVSPILSMTFGALVAHLSEQLCLYLELASLGELRHGCVGARRLKPCLSKLENAGTESSMSLLRLISMVKNCNTSFNARGFKDQDEVISDKPYRMAAWSIWDIVKEEFGIEAYMMMSHYFKIGPFGGSIGGEKWAHIIDTARRFREGEYTPIMFIDTCFGLKHNCNLAFDKFWDVVYIRDVLDAVQEGTPERMMFIEHFASRPVRQLHREWRISTYGPTSAEKEAQAKQAEGQDTFHA